MSSIVGSQWHRAVAAHESDQSGLVNEFIKPVYMAVYFSFVCNRYKQRSPIVGSCHGDSSHSDYCCTKLCCAIFHTAYSKACRIPTTLPTGVAFGTCKSGLWLSKNYACTVACAQGYVADASTARKNLFWCQNGKFVATPQLVCRPVQSMSRRRLVVLIHDYVSKLKPA